VPYEATRVRHHGTDRKQPRAEPTVLQTTPRGTMTCPFLHKHCNFGMYVGDPVPGFFGTGGHQANRCVDGRTSGCARALIA
jgi:hypothetical protein